METVIGFAVGYWVGTRHGREGLQRAIDAARDIYTSPEARRLAEDALSAARSAAVPVSGVIDQATGARRRELIRDVLDEVVERRFGRHAAAA